MNLTDITCVKGFIRMCNDGWLQGWHERNGGNLTYREPGRRILHHDRFGQVFPQRRARPDPLYRHC